MTIPATISASDKIAILVGVSGEIDGIFDKKLNIIIPFSPSLKLLRRKLCC